MAKPGRRWFPLDVAFTRDEQVLEVGERAFWLYLAMLAHIYESKKHGVISVRELNTIYLKGESWRKRIPPLLKVGMVVQLDPDVYHVPAWEGWQPNEHRAAYMRSWREQKRREVQTQLHSIGGEKTDPTGEERLSQHSQLEEDPGSDL